MALQKCLKRSRKCSTAICCLLTGKWEMAQNPQVKSFLNELLERCILQLHAKDLTAPPVLLVDGPASALEKA